MRISSKRVGGKIINTIKAKDGLNAAIKCRVRKMLAGTKRGTRLEFQSGNQLELLGEWARVPKDGGLKNPRGFRKANRRYEEKYKKCTGGGRVRSFVPTAAW